MRRVSSPAAGATLRPAAAPGDEAAAFLVALGGAFAGVLQVQDVTVTHALTGGANGAALALALLAMAADTARWDHLLSAAAAIVCAALCHKYGALAQSASAEQRLVLWKANLVAGWLLYLGQLGFDAWAPERELA